MPAGFWGAFAGGRARSSGRVRKITIAIRRMDAIAGATNINTSLAFIRESHCFGPKIKSSIS